MADEAYANEIGFQVKGFEEWYGLGAESTPESQQVPRKPNEQGQTATKARKHESLDV